MNAIKKALSAFRDFLFLATRNWVSALGVVLASFAAISFLAILAVNIGGEEQGNYQGIISYIILPTVFILGLILIPIGVRLLRRKERAGKPTGFPVLNFNDPRARTIALVVFVLTVLNLMIISVASYRGLHVLHSDAFCGETCHNVMEPQRVAHEVTTHANVYCADCHVGEGAVHFARSKLNGTRQLFQFILGDYSRPIPQPTGVPNTICVRCHATDQYRDDRLHIRRTFDDSEKPVEKVTIFRTLIGGLRNGKWKGAHTHNGMRVRYLGDPSRKTISEIEVTRADGTSDRFVSSKTKTPAGAVWSEMGCTDCHSRPAHQFSAPETVVDRALSRGAIDKGLPFIKREAVAVLKTSYPSRDEARKAIPAALNASYAKLAPSLDADGKAKVDAAGKVLAEAWAENNFPDMKVTWGTYVNFFQHDGCYRCHDTNHVNAKGDAVQQKCAGACHDIIADHEEKPEALDVLYP